MKTCRHTNTGKEMTMGNVAMKNEDSTPIERDSEDRAAGGISLAAALGGTMLRWGTGTNVTSAQRATFRP
jgi:hypothetical protein